MESPRKPKSTTMIFLALRVRSKKVFTDPAAAIAGLVSRARRDWRQKTAVFVTDLRAKAV
jgi:hypothetical protein